jgi:class 3 adenylate cyclase
LAERSAAADAEDLREVISIYQECVAETVRSFDGFVAKYMGDGVLIYFGYPQAHEDDAERFIGRWRIPIRRRLAAHPSAIPLIHS